MRDREREDRRPVILSRSLGSSNIIVEDGGRTPPEKKSTATTGETLTKDSPSRDERLEKGEAEGDGGRSPAMVAARAEKCWGVKAGKSSDMRR
jgi:hypothetical protein